MRISSWDSIDYDNLEYDSKWVEPDSNHFFKMHSIHSYPAKFPAFLASEALVYAKLEGVQVKDVADVFCGCGTTALESKRAGMSFWGCDINPLATMITRVKTLKYDIDKLSLYYSHLKGEFSASLLRDDSYYSEANERLKYWFDEATYNQLYYLLLSIRTVTELDKDYYEAFLCLFSSILKSCSRWLQKSIKPQIDPSKQQKDVMQLFNQKYDNFVKAVKEINDNCLGYDGSITILNENFLNVSEFPKVDLILSSPPYVTSYEYADLHQLSLLWLKYTDDYREFRKGSIGSTYNTTNWNLDGASLNSTASSIVSQLQEIKCQGSKIKSIARYYDDMEKAIANCRKMLNNGGMVFFVVGDSEYKGVNLTNSKHIVECLFESGFSDIKMEKRIISKGICVPFRNKRGRFTIAEESQKKIYHEEYLVTGRVL